MTKTLFLKTNILPDEESRSLALSKEFIKQLKTKEETKVKTYDLNTHEYGQTITSQNYKEVFFAKDSSSVKLAKEFITYDNIIVELPLYNEMAPATLVNFFTHAIFANISFKFDKSGDRVSLAKKNINVYLISATGGDYDLDAPHIKQVKNLFEYVGLEVKDVLQISSTDIRDKDGNKPLIKILVDSQKENINRVLTK